MLVLFLLVLLVLVQHVLLVRLLMTFPVLCLAHRTAVHPSPAHLNIYNFDKVFKHLNIYTLNTGPQYTQAPNFYINFRYVNILTLKH